MPWILRIQRQEIEKKEWNFISVTVISWIESNGHFTTLCSLPFNEVPTSHARIKGLLLFDIPVESSGLRVWKPIPSPQDPYPRTGFFLSWCLSQPRLNGAQAGSANAEMMRSASPVCDHWNGRQVLVSFFCFQKLLQLQACGDRVWVEPKQWNRLLHWKT